MSSWFGGGSSSSPSGRRLSGSPGRSGGGGSRALDPSTATMADLRALYARLIECSKVTPKTMKTLIELLRQVSELVLYGEKNSERIFDFFCERNILATFVDICRQQCPAIVHTQVVQTLSILVQNVRNETSLYYLLSNNYVNQIIEIDFGPDENLQDQYISFLKTLALRLNMNTIQFFYNDENDTFPLLVRAIDHLAQPEQMKRTAAQTIILNVYQVEDERMRTLALAEHIRIRLFHQLTSSMTSQFSRLVSTVTDAQNEASIARRPFRGARTADRISGLFARLEDHLYYLQDIFDLGIPGLGDHLARYIVSNFIYPVILHAVVACSAAEFVFYAAPARSKRPPAVLSPHAPASSSATASAVASPAGSGGSGGWGATAPKPGEPIIRRSVSEKRSPASTLLSLTTPSPSSSSSSFSSSSPLAAAAAAGARAGSQGSSSSPRGSGVGISARHQRRDIADNGEKLRSASGASNGRTPPPGGAHRSRNPFVVASPQHRARLEEEVSMVFALAVLVHLYNIVSYPPLIHMVTVAIFHPLSRRARRSILAGDDIFSEAEEMRASAHCQAAVTGIASPAATTPSPRGAGSSGGAGVGAGAPVRGGAGGEVGSIGVLPNNPHVNSNRRAFVRLMGSGVDRIAMLCTALLDAVLQNPAMAPDVLTELGLRPLINSSMEGGMGAQGVPRQTSEISNDGGSSLEGPVNALRALRRAGGGESFTSSNGGGEGGGERGGGDNGAQCAADNGSHDNTRIEVSGSGQDRDNGHGDRGDHDEDVTALLAMAQSSEPENEDGEAADQFNTLATTSMVLTKPRRHDVSAYGRNKTRTISHTSTLSSGTSASVDPEDVRASMAMFAGIATDGDSPRSSGSFVTAGDDDDNSVPATTPGGTSRATDDVAPSSASSDTGQGASTAAQSPSATEVGKPTDSDNDNENGSLPAPPPPNASALATTALSSSPASQMHFPVPPPGPPLSPSVGPVTAASRGGRSMGTAGDEGAVPTLSSATETRGTDRRVSASVDRNGPPPGMRNFVRLDQRLALHTLTDEIMDDPDIIILVRNVPIRAAAALRVELAVQHIRERLEQERQSEDANAAIALARATAEDMVATPTTAGSGSTSEFATAVAHDATGALSGESDPSTDSAASTSASASAPGSATLAGEVEATYTPTGTTDATDTIVATEATVTTPQAVAVVVPVVTNVGAFALPKPWLSPLQNLGGVVFEMLSQQRTLSLATLRTTCSLISRIFNPGHAHRARTSSTSSPAAGHRARGRADSASSTHSSSLGRHARSGSAAPPLGGHMLPDELWEALRYAHVSAAAALLNFLHTEAGETLVGLVEDEAVEFKQRLRRVFAEGGPAVWLEGIGTADSVAQLVCNPWLVMPANDECLAQLGLTYVVPTSDAVVCRRAVHVFFLLRVMVRAFMRDKALSVSIRPAPTVHSHRPRRGHSSLEPQPLQQNLHLPHLAASANHVRSDTGVTLDGRSTHTDSTVFDAELSATTQTAGSSEEGDSLSFTDAVGGPLVSPPPPAPHATAVADAVLSGVPAALAPTSANTADKDGGNAHSPKTRQRQNSEDSKDEWDDDDDLWQVLAHMSDVQTGALKRFPGRPCLPCSVMVPQEDASPSLSPARDGGHGKGKGKDKSGKAQQQRRSLSPRRVTPTASKSGDRRQQHGGARTAEDVVRTRPRALSRIVTAASDTFLILDDDMFLIVAPEGTHGGSDPRQHFCLVRCSVPMRNVIVTVGAEDPKTLRVSVRSSRPVGLMRKLAAGSGSGSGSGAHMAGGLSSGTGGGGASGPGDGLVRGSVSGASLWHCWLQFGDETSAKVAERHLRKRKAIQREQTKEHIVTALESVVDADKDLLLRYGSALASPPAAPTRSRQSSSTSSVGAARTTSETATADTEASSVQVDDAHSDLGRLSTSAPT